MAKMTIGSVRAVKMAIDAAAQGARSEDDLARQLRHLALESPLAWAECDREAAALEKARKAAKRRAYAAIDARASM